MLTTTTRTRCRSEVLAVDGTTVNATASSHLEWPPLPRAARAAREPSAPGDSRGNHNEGGAPLAHARRLRGGDRDAVLQPTTKTILLMMMMLMIHGAAACEDAKRARERAVRCTMPTPSLFRENCRRYGGDGVVDALRLPVGRTRLERSSGMEDEAAQVSLLMKHGDADRAAVRG